MNDKTNQSAEALGLEAKGTEHAAAVGEYGGIIEVLVLRCYHSNPSKTRSSSPSSSVKSGRSSGRSSYMDDEEVPVLTGAMFDGAGDTPPPQNCKRSFRSFEKAKERSTPLLRLKSGGGSPPDSDRARSHRYDGKVTEGNPSRFRVGEPLFYSGEDRTSLRRRHQVVKEGKPRLRLRGGGHSEVDPSKKRPHPSTISFKAYRSGRGDLPIHVQNPKGYSRSHIPGETSNADVTMKQKEGSTGSYTPDETWGGMGAAGADDQWHTQNTWDWELRKQSIKSDRGGSSDDRSKEDKLQSPGKVSRQKPGHVSTKSWTSGDVIRMDANQNDHRDGADDTQKKDDDWGNTKEDNQRENSWDRPGNADDNNQQGGGSNAVHTDNIGVLNNDWGDIDTGNDDHHVEWGSTADENDQNHDWAVATNENGPNDVWGITDRANQVRSWDMGNDQKADSGAGSADNYARSGSSVRGEAKIPAKKQVARKTPPQTVNKVGSPIHKSKSQHAHNRISRPPSVLTPSKSLCVEKGMVSKAPSVTSVRSALKSSRGSLAPAKASLTEWSKKVVDKSESIPGAWSPPLGKKKKILRSDSTKRRAAEFNAERAQAQAAELDAKSAKTQSNRSNPTPPRSAGIFKGVSKRTTRAPTSVTSNIYQSHHKRPSTIVEEQPRVVDVTNDNALIHEGRSLSAAEYIHKTAVPHYMDTIDDPYAHFVFHYREMNFISKMCGFTIGETKEVLQDRLASLTKDELIDLLVEERLTANKEREEKLSMKTSQGSAGYEPNLNAANQKLNEWEKNNDDGGEEVWGNEDGGGSGWGNDNGGGNDWGESSNGQDQNEQGGNSRRNSNKNNSADDQRSGQWDNSNDTSGGNRGWGASNDYGEDNNDPSWGANSGGGNEEGW